MRKSIQNNSAETNSNIRTFWIIKKKAPQVKNMVGILFQAFPNEKNTPNNGTTASLLLTLSTSVFSFLLVTLLLFPILANFFLTHSYNTLFLTFPILLQKTTLTTLSLSYFFLHMLHILHFLSLSPTLLGLCMYNKCN